MSLNDSVLEGDQDFWKQAILTRRRHMTPKQNTVNLALMCKTNNNKQNPQSSNTGEYRVGNWVISEAKRKELLGGTVVLTQSQKTPAYLGGTIVGFNPTQNGKKCEVIFKEDKSLVGNDDAVGHNGWGSGRGVCYV